MAYEATTEVAPQDAGGLPQLNVATFEEQLIWLFLTFVVLLFFVSRIALPSVTRAMQAREEAISHDLDVAERLRGEAETIKSSYEDALASARKAAHDSALSAREEIQSSVDKAQHELETRLNADTEAAEERIAAASKDAMASLEEAATEVAGDLVAKLSGEAADGAAIAAAVKAAKEA